MTHTDIVHTVKYNILHTCCISDKLKIQLYYLSFVPCLLQHHKLSFGSCLSAKNVIKIKYSSINCIFLSKRLITKTILLMLNQSISQ